jgi:hypothetical protein
MIIKTETGSVYRLTETTWEREGETELRTRSGTIIEMNTPEVGGPLIMRTDSLTGLPRVIVSSNIVEILE